MLKEAESLATKTEPEHLLEAHTKESPALSPDLVVRREGVNVKTLNSSSKALSEQEMANRIKLNQQLMELDGNVTMCRNAKIEWLECDDALIAHLCGGKFPAEGYMIYKNIRLCSEGGAEAIAKKERLTIEQIMFPKGGEMFVGQVKK